MKTNKKQRKNSNGITLIALVITIIVLLILAGVSIAMLTGDNGILTQAQNAKNRTEEAQREEENILTNYEDYINNATLDTAIVGEIVTGGNKQYSKNGKAIIPEGFAIVPGLDDVSQGLVISDVANDTENKGNQFVWVPVENFSEFKRYDFQNNEELSSSYTEESGDGVSTGTEAQDMYKSVNDNKGFYIGRYEAGNDGSNNAISKKGVKVYNVIPWENYYEIIGAVEKARNFDTQSGHTNVTSTLVYGVQWDAVMRWLSRGTAEEQGWLTDSAGKGNYSGTLNETTGSDDNYQMKHIYDLAGNVFEWTMEARNNNNRVCRGGDYNSKIYETFCSIRYDDSPAHFDTVLGFRLAMYIK